MRKVFSKGELDLLYPGSVVYYNFRYDGIIYHRLAEKLNTGEWVDIDDPVDANDEYVYLSPIVPCWLVFDRTTEPN